MLKRIDDFFTFFDIDKNACKHGVNLSSFAGVRAKGMVYIKDYEALLAIALHFKPKLIFEIGTYYGVTSNFFLSLLPDCKVVSIAYINSESKDPGNDYNNSELIREQIGTKISDKNRKRFTQLYGDSHLIDSKSLIQKHGYFDLVFIDGDHSAEGVSLDTELAKKIITKSGVICWHDANPKAEYMDVRKFLENDLSLSAIATKDEYIGGIAAWSKEIENKLR